MFSLIYIDIAFSKISKIDFRACEHLQKIVADEQQKIKVWDQRIIWLLLSQDFKIPIHANKMPLKSTGHILDTQNVYKKQKISYGFWYKGQDLYLSDGTQITFDSNKLHIASRFDERNLVFCKQLNLQNSSITSVDTTYLSSLCVLILYRTRIDALSTSPLMNLQYLNISETMIQEIDTESLTKLEQLWASAAGLAFISTKMLQNLTLLNIIDTQIAILEAKNLVNLKELYLCRSLILNLDVSMLEQLTFVSCSRNQQVVTREGVKKLSQYSERAE